MERAVLRRDVFALFQAYIYDNIGISLGDHKIYLVQARLAKRLKQLELTSFEAYYEWLIRDQSGHELTYLSSLISTNVTSFFRESKQWDFFKNVLPAVAARNNGKIRIWSAACSSGEEPYSIAMFCQEHLKGLGALDLKILATDVSENVLKKAIKGVYTSKACTSLKEGYLQKYFTLMEDEDQTCYRIDDTLKRHIVFRGFNLVTGNYSLFRDKTFDFIFCRNVMIYFDKPTQHHLVNRFHRMLSTEGYLFIGSSEALTDAKQAFKACSASIYQKG
jgi:chemotaxis protein methyltransferase CheR